MSRLGVNADQLAPVARLELHEPVNGGVKGEISALPYVLTGVKLGAMLPDDDGARWNPFAAESLHTQALTRTIPTVAA
jgi:hypothetical protein